MHSGALHLGRLHIPSPGNARARHVVACSYTVTGSPSTHIPAGVIVSQLCQWTLNNAVVLGGGSLGGYLLAKGLSDTNTENELKAELKQLRNDVMTTRLAVARLEHLHDDVKGIEADIEYLQGGSRRRWLSRVSEASIPSNHKQSQTGEAEANDKASEFKADLEQLRQELYKARESVSELNDLPARLKDVGVDLKDLLGAGHVTALPAAVNPPYSRYNRISLLSSWWSDRSFQDPPADIKTDLQKLRSDYLETKVALARLEYLPAVVKAIQADIKRLLDKKGCTNVKATSTGITAPLGQ